MEDEDAAARADEAEALTAILGESDVRIRQEGSVIEIDLPGGASPTTLTLVAHLPADYPSASPPCVEVRLPLESRHRLAAADAAAAAAATAVADAFTPGCVVLYEVAEVLRERELALGVAAAAEEAAREERLAELNGGGHTADAADDDEEAERGGGLGPSRHAPPPPDADTAFPALAASLGIVSHPPVAFKKSTFQAHVARVATPAAARVVVDALLTNRRVAAATHNIMAYRIVQESGAVLADCDDDGEAAAGGRLAHMLAAARVEGAVVVVSRWFGGVLLGPARFGLINNTARDALVAQGFIQEAGSGGTRRK